MGTVPGAIDRKTTKRQQEKHQQAQLPAQVYQKAVSDGYDPQIAQLMADKVKQDLKVQELEQRLQVVNNVNPRSKDNLPWKT